MQPHDINTTIAELTYLFDNLNKRWESDPCATDLYQVYRQTEYRDAFEKLKNVNFESLILGIITNSLNEKILTRLHLLISDSIQIYEARQNDFIGIDFHAVYSFHEKHLFGDKFALLRKDKEDIQNFPYPTEQEREMLLKENQKEKNLLENERSDYLRANTWILKDYYTEIYRLSKSFSSIIESYFPNEKEETPIPEPISTGTKTISETESESTIEPDMIFRTGMFDKLLILEKKLIANKYLNPELHWISVHDNGKPDIKKLVTFLVGLLGHKYFLPGRDPKIKTFFETRYHITIGQNFERKRRETLSEEYKAVFCDYPF